MSIVTKIVANPPSKLHTLAELRVFWELGGFVCTRYLMKQFAKGDGHPVILLPGFMASDTGMTPLRKLLTDLGHDAQPWYLGRHTEFSQTKAATLIARIEGLYQQHGQKVSLVGWSMGGVLARELAKAIPEHIRSVITLGSPITADLDFTIARKFYEMLNGSTERDPDLLENLPFAPPVPTTTIYSRSDGIVSWQGAVQARHESTPMTENIRVNCSHLGMVVNPFAVYVVANRLAQSEGEWDYFDSSPLLRPFIEAHGNHAVT